MIVQKSLVELALEEVKRLIATGEMPAEHRILEAHLSEELGVSRPTLREALRILAAQHILEFSPRRGYRVVGLSDEDADEIFGLRRLLEEFALERIAARIAEVDLTAMRKTMRLMWKEARDGDAIAVQSAHRQFHIQFIELADHRRLLESFVTLMNHTELYMMRSVSREAENPGGLLESSARHEELLDALDSRSPATARAAWVQHADQHYFMTPAKEPERAPQLLG